MRKGTRFITLALASVGFLGSLYIELFQNQNPCHFCLVIRYSMLSIFLISLVGIFSKYIFYFSLLPIAVAGYADAKLIALERNIDIGICTGVVCETPIFLGVRLSVWAMFIITSIFLALFGDILSELLRIRKERLKYKRKWHDIDRELKRGED